MGVHRFAVATALATFCLLIAGGLVSATESGLACPDWPLCEGKYFPKMVDGKQFEHTHRLVASGVGAMTFALSAMLIKRRRRDRKLARLGVAAAVLVIFQALLGALTVKLALPAWVSSLHQATAMAFFCLMVSLAFLTRQRLNGAASPAPVPRASRSFRRLVLGVTALTYLQICAGAVMRHTRGGLACGFDFPLCLGKLWPMDGHLGIQAHMIHRAGGLAVTIALLALAAWVVRNVQQRALRILAITVAIAVIAQLGLGIATILASRELITMTVHSSLGAALLAALVSAYWLASPSSPPSIASGVATQEAPAPSLETA